MNSTMGINSTAVGILMAFLLQVQQNYSMPNLVRFHASVKLYSSIWEAAMVLPLPKTSSTSVLLSDFRPISILSVLSKGVERILYDQLVAYLESNSLLSQFQSGFRKCHSTAAALVKIIYDIQLGVEA
jgi:hypothetical protein